MQPRSRDGGVAAMTMVIKFLPVRAGLALSELFRGERGHPPCISAAPAALDRYLTTSPAMSLIPFAPFAKATAWLKTKRLISGRGRRRFFQSADRGGAAPSKALVLVGRN